MKIIVIFLSCIVIYLSFTIIAQRNLYQRDLREQEEVYTTEIKRLLGKCKENNKSVQAPEHISNKGGR